MRLKQIVERGRPLVLALGFTLVLLTAGISAADREVLPGEVLLLSDEIFGNSAEITRPSAAGPADNNRSGLGDVDPPEPEIRLAALGAVHEVLEIGEGDRGQDPDDREGDQQLYEREAMGTPRRSPTRTLEGAHGSQHAHSSLPSAAIRPARP